MAETITRRAAYGRKTTRTARYPNVLARTRAYGQAVQRAAGFFGDVTASFSPENVLFEYFEADDLTVGDGNSVDSWAGRNGNATLTQPGASNLKPTFRASTGGASLPGVEFDGIDDYLIADALASLFAKTGSADTHPEATIFAVMSSVGTVNDYPITAGSSAGLNSAWFVENRNNLRTTIRAALSDILFSDGYDNPLRSTDVTLLQRVNAADNTVDMWDGSTQKLTDAAISTSTAEVAVNRFTIGVYRYSSLLGFTAMKVHAIGVIGTPLSDSEVTDLLDYAANKWGY